MSLCPKSCTRGFSLSGVSWFFKSSLEEKNSVADTDKAFALNRSSRDDSSILHNYFKLLFCPLHSLVLERVRCIRQSISVRLLEGYNHIGGPFFLLNLRVSADRKRSVVDSVLRQLFGCLNDPLGFSGGCIINVTYLGQVAGAIACRLECLSGTDDPTRPGHLHPDYP